MEMKDKDYSCVSPEERLNEIRKLLDINNDLNKREPIVLKKLIDERDRLKEGLEMTSKTENENRHLKKVIKNWEKVLSLVIKKLTKKTTIWEDLRKKEQNNWEENYYGN